MGEPNEIIAAPYTLYTAPVGTAFPTIDADPAAAWIKVGTSGDRSYSDDGVTVTHSQTISQARPLGATGPVKAWRTEEDMIVALTLWDLSLEQYALAMNGNTVTTTAAGVGTAGIKSLQLYRGVNVATMALLVRGDVSAYGDGLKSQYEVPVCYQSANPAPVFVKGDPAGLALEFTVLEDPDAASAAARFGRLIMQSAVALEE